ncbi:MAG: hypothetical protein IH892_06480 [Planctomycetes bacterium]|nr:hypothetical protein [Planctomycetota bacterium]
MGQETPLWRANAFTIQSLARLSMSDTGIDDSHGNHAKTSISERNRSVSSPSILAQKQRFFAIGFNACGE